LASISVGSRNSQVTWSITSKTRAREKGHGVQFGKRYRGLSGKIDKIKKIGE
jgi:hypothetical protein